MSVNKSLRIAGTLAGTLLVNALMVGDPSPAGAAMAMAPQGASRTVSMQDLCGDCQPEKFVQSWKGPRSTTRAICGWSASRAATSRR
jgi:hypothetical protein